MSDPGQRPRPQFGEYASPDEQRAHIREPLDHGKAAELGVNSVSAPEPAAAQEPLRPAEQTAPAAAAGTQTKKRASSGDRVATSVLLGIGLFSIFISMPMLTDLPGAIRPAFVQFGISGYSSDALARVLGITAIVSQAVLWAAALLWSRRRLAAGRVAFWIPIVAGVIANTVVMVCLIVAMVADPAFAAYVDSAGG